MENQVNFICDDRRHIPGDLNPADLAMREGVVTDVMCNHWLMGPKFLLYDTFWPKQKEFGVAQQRLVLKEAEKPPVNTEATIKTFFAATEINDGITNVINLNKFSSFTKITQFSSYVSLITSRSPSKRKLKR